MAAKIEQSIGGADVELVDGGRGDFIVKLHGDDQVDELWNKNGPDRGFPDEDHIIDMIRVRQ